ncbi:3-hydroxyisobutyryl-CoA hydrolase, mitochondrial isoform X1 [Drosophila eugracilis]|uniref:3-hydroxyisobutyryl-CoA hydrolase, mitochondrial isoform X1 n=2 Tax=Drosophila eugracilis TaxID=29029 RepID=UPI0007E6E937|nr:3-hydroxyisobutyryl-CoA hydrolase, mitochondrial isoform X1 [Drosophila eugracilis]
MQGPIQRLVYTFGHRTCSQLPMIGGAAISSTKPSTMALSVRQSSSSVLATESSNKGMIILNRPKALNAINLEMVRKIYKHLKKCEKSKSLLIIKGTGDKAFCAGGDVRALVEAGPTDESKSFFREEYSTNALIGNYKIPYIAIIDGITMGGGVGLSVHGKYRVATDRTLFAMPETAIGLFPDVGGSYFLPRLQGKLGLYLGLTGYRLRGGDVFFSGIATHYCDSSKIPDLETELLNCPDADDVPELLQKFHSTPEKPFSLQPFLEQINKNFSADCVEGILENLQNDGSEWAKKTLETLSKMSPTSMKVTFRQLELGSQLSLAQCLIMEYRLAVRHLERSDFKEGVRALLIDKDQKPLWQPTKLADVTDEHVQWFFRKLPDTEELKLE